jgi:hypothetical protein
MTEQHIQPKRRPRGWRRLGLTGAALAVIAVVGAATANQALAEETQGATRPTMSAAATEATDTTKGSEDKPRVKTGVSGIAALEAALSQVVPTGVVADPSAMNYEPSRDGWPNAFGHLTFAPSPGAASSEATVTYWPVKPGDAELHSQCQGLMDDCETLTLPDGSVVLSYVVSGPGVAPGMGASTLIAVHRVVGDNVVSLAAGSPEVEPGAPAADPVLTRDQLIELISGSEWAELPKA